MRIALVYNPAAGRGLYDAADLERLFRERGYDVTTFGKSRSDVRHAAESAPNVLVVAGGDGTVAKAALALRFRGIPLYVLPMGTANNIARSLGIDAPVPQLIAALANARESRLDIGHAASRNGAMEADAYFVEAAGVGFIGTMLRRKGSLAWRIEHFIRDVIPGHDKRLGLARLIRRQPARRFQLMVDGEDLSGDYVSVEIMNIGTIGPRVVLAPGANHGDGLLDVVLVREADRDDLIAHVMARGASWVAPSVNVRRARAVEMSWIPEFGHVDDEPWPDRGSTLHGARVCVSTGDAIPVLLPVRE